MVLYFDLLSCYFSFELCICLFYMKKKTIPTSVDENIKQIHIKSTKENKRDKKGSRSRLEDVARASETKMNEMVLFFACARNRNAMVNRFYDP